MKLTTTLALFAAGVSASRFQQLRLRDLAEVESIVTTVLGAIQTFDGQVSNFTGGDPSNLSSDCTKMVYTVKTAVKNLNPVSNVSLQDAYNFKPLSDQMNAAGDKLLDDLDSQVSLFKSLGLCSYVYPGIQELGDSVVSLMKTVASKFPDPSASADEVTHFTGRFASLEDKLKACSVTGPSDSKPDCTTVAVPSATSGPGYAKPAPPTGEFNGTRPTSPSQVPYVQTAGATTHGISAAFVLVATLLATLL